MLFSQRYFEDDEEESSSNVDLPYIPAENSPTRQQMQAGGGSDSEDDPLDAFMTEVEVRKEFKDIMYFHSSAVFLNYCYFPPEPSSQRHEEARGKGEKVSQVRITFFPLSGFSQILCPFRFRPNFGLSYWRFVFKSSYKMYYLPIIIK